MRYQMPNYPCEFEIPDSWLAEAGMNGFSPTESAFCSSVDAVLVPLTEVEPPMRRPTTLKDWRGFDHDRLLRILKGFVEGDEIPWVPLLELPHVSEFTPRPYRYRVRDGYHRYYASVAAGFECLPGSVQPA